MEKCTCDKTNQEACSNCGKTYSFESVKVYKSGFRFTGLTRRKDALVISKSLVDMFSWNNVYISIDKKNKAIMITPTEEKNTYKISTKSTGSKVVSFREKEMPLGRYYFKEKIGEGFVCVLKSN
jgi:hypothetical protein